MNWEENSTHKVIDGTYDKRIDEMIEKIDFDDKDFLKMIL